MFMTLATILVVLFNCYATADILTKFLQQCFLLAHLSRRLIGELLVYKGIRRPSVRPSVVRQHFQTTSPLKPRSRFFSYFTYSIYRSVERIIAFFVPVGKELWLLWQLIVPIDLQWEKWKLKISAKSLGIFDFFFLQK